MPTIVAPPPSPTHFSPSAELPPPIEVPCWWALHDVLPNFHQSNHTYQLKLKRTNTPLKTNGKRMNEDEQKKYELVLIETAAIVVRGHQNPEDLLAVFDGGFPKVGFPEGPLDLCKTILNEVSYVCGIALKEMQMVSHLTVSIFQNLSYVTDTLPDAHKV
jgi:hypothetical protein